MENKPIPPHLLAASRNASLAAIRRLQRISALRESDRQRIADALMQVPSLDNPQITLPEEESFAEVAEQIVASMKRLGARTTGEAIEMVLRQQEAAE